jgi:hypothetical protein
MLSSAQKALYQATQRRLFATSMDQAKAQVKNAAGLAKDATMSMLYPALMGLVAGAGLKYFYDVYTTITPGEVKEVMRHPLHHAQYEQDVLNKLDIIHERLASVEAFMARSEADQRSKAVVAGKK